MLLIMCIALFFTIILLNNSWNKLVEREGYGKEYQENYYKNRYNCFL